MENMRWEQGSFSALFDLCFPGNSSSFRSAGVQLKKNTSNFKYFFHIYLFFNIVYAHIPGKSVVGFFEFFPQFYTKTFTSNYISSRTFEVRYVSQWSQCIYYIFWRGLNVKCLKHLHVYVCRFSTFLRKYLKNLDTWVRPMHFFIMWRKRIQFHKIKKKGKLIKILFILDR